MIDATVEDMKELIGEQTIEIRYLNQKLDKAVRIINAQKAIIDGFQGGSARTMPTPENPV